MSAILSADDLNDFISPGVACIKPVETLPKQRPDTADIANPYEVTTEDRVQQNGVGKEAQISLTDCLACSGCVTSAEAVLVGLQSHDEVLKTLDQHRSVLPVNGELAEDGMIFVASVSPQTKANIATTYGITSVDAGYLIEQLLAGPTGLMAGGEKKSGFTWVIDTNSLREICHTACLEEASSISCDGSTRPSNLNYPILSSACPGWVCYAEKTHPHVLPHLSRVKSPQALSGTLIKSVLSRQFGVSPDRIWHLAVMPCFDKKLEASREELTDAYWRPEVKDPRGVRDVDCVITAREVVMLADTRGISLPNLPKLPVDQVLFPDDRIDQFLFSRDRRRLMHDQAPISGSSGGYAYQILKRRQSQFPASEIRMERGRNADVVEYSLVQGDRTLIKTARYYGFRNIQNLVRRLKPPKPSRLPGSKLASNAATRRTEMATSGPMKEYLYVEVMACPGGCTNGGGQIKINDLAGLVASEGPVKPGPAEQKEWLAKVDEAYYSADSSSGDEGDAMDVDIGYNTQPMNVSDPGSCNDKSDTSVKTFLDYWSSSTNIELEKLLHTTYREVQSDVGKSKGISDTERVAGLANTIGGGW